MRFNRNVYFTVRFRPSQLPRKSVACVRSTDLDYVEALAQSSFLGIVDKLVSSEYLPFRIRGLFL
jgi:hypothetical protein